MSLNTTSRPWTTADHEQLFNLLRQKISAIKIAHIMNRPMTDIRPALERCVREMRRAKISDAEIAAQIGWKLADVNAIGPG